MGSGIGGGAALVFVASMFTQLCDEPPHGGGSRDAAGAIAESQAIAEQGAVRGGAGGEPAHGRAGAASDARAAAGSGGRGSVSPTVNVLDQDSGLACFIASNARMTCWGQAPATTPPEGTYQSVGVGAGHACAVKSDGGVVCWGNTLPAPGMPPAGKYLEVTSGDAFSCGLRSDNTIVCWGANSYGQSTPPAGRFIDIVAGDSHACGIRSDRTLTCWGYAQEGITKVPAGEFQSVASNGSFACAVRSNGSATCWGRGSPGDPTGRFVRISAGFSQAGGLRAHGAASRWGSSSGTPIPETESFIAMSAGFGTCAARANDSVVCWSGSVNDGTYPPPPALVQCSAAADCTAVLDAPRCGKWSCNAANRCESLPC
jgi:hypothetical protein